MSTVYEIRKRTAEKLAQQPQPAAGQRPIEGCVIPAHLRHRLESIRVRCEASVEARQRVRDDTGEWS